MHRTLRRRIALKATVSSCHPQCHHTHDNVQRRVLVLDAIRDVVFEAAVSARGRLQAVFTPQRPLVIERELG